jgi:hypothetical protein
LTTTPSGRTTLTELDTSDILSRLTWIKSSEVIDRYGFGDFLEIVREVRKGVSDDVWLEVGWEILEGMGLEEFYGCDYDILPALEHIPSKSELVDIQTFLRHSLVETLFELFNSGGTTILLDVAEMVGTPAAALIPKIIELRKKEIERTVVPIIGKEVILYNVYMEEIGRTSVPEESVHLEPLWFTAYGYQILFALGFGFLTTLEGLSKITQTMSRLGVNFTLERNEKYVINTETIMSKAMRTIVLKRAFLNSSRTR